MEIPAGVFILVHILADSVCSPWDSFIVHSFLLAVINILEQETTYCYDRSTDFMAGTVHLRFMSIHAVSQNYVLLGRARKGEVQV